jgi:rhodanese-related sulfurtransferase/CBS domain-containing protein
MPTEIHRTEVQRLLKEEDAQLVEVLPAEEYEAEHIAGAINIPLKDLNADTASRLDHNRPVIVYCYDYQCDMSPRAAWRLETLGFSQVFDYAASKTDWFASGLPREGRDASIPRAGDAADQDVPTCLLTEQVGQVRDRVEQLAWDSCLVINPERVVLGRVRGKALDADAETPIEQVMEEGPTTTRPDTRLEDLLERMHERKVDSIIVTTLDGRLVGVLSREAAEQAVANSSTAVAGATQ